jgi:flagellar basal body rod protein FlgG
LDIGCYIAGSGVTACERVLENVAHNLANVSTPSFKKVMMQQSSLSFAFPEGSDGLSQALAFPRLSGPIRNPEQGELVPTNNPLDLAIEGKGFFEVQGPAGPLQTRNGRFVLDAEGNLVTSQGLAVRDEQGQAIRIDPGQIVEVAPNGEIYVGEVKEGLLSPQGRLRVVDETGAVLNEEEYKVRQRHVEASNVNPMQEMVKMMEQLRCHDAYVKLIRGFADLEEKTVTEIGRL